MRGAGEGFWDVQLCIEHVHNLCLHLDLGRAMLKTHDVESVVAGRKPRGLPGDN